MKRWLRFWVVVFLLAFLFVSGLSGFWYLEMPAAQLQSGWYPRRLSPTPESDIQFTRQRPQGWVNFDQISPHVKNAIIITEDWAFYSHQGVDSVQLNDAVKESWQKGRLVRGASTISQQLVKNLFLSNERSLLRKWKELVLTIKLEKELKKNRILELYLNVIEFGPGVYGIGRAAGYYFGKHPRDLSVRESAFLALLLPSPSLYSTSFRRRELTDFARQRIQRITSDMVRARKISPEQREQALKERFYWEPAPIEAEEIEADEMDSIEVDETAATAVPDEIEETETGEIEADPWFSKDERLPSE